MKYTAKYFKDDLPEWKKRKDPTNCRFFVRPLSFFVSAFCANHKITANEVSYFSVVIALVSCICFLFNDRYTNIIGAVLINLWLLLDCVDGNLARSVKKQPFGEFADALSSYVMVAFMCTAFGYFVYVNGGVMVSVGQPICIVIGAIASTFDTLARLIYQKFRNTEMDLEKEKKIKSEMDLNKDHDSTGRLIVRAQEALGVGGWLPHFILFAVIFNFMDLILIYCFFFYGAFFVAGTILNLRKVLRYQKEGSR